MAIKKLKPTTSGQRHQSRLITKAGHTNHPYKGLVNKIKAHSGRNQSGRVTVRHHGGGVKRLYRLIDFRRDKKDIEAKVAAIEYDPNRNANIALLYYADGEKRYILAPEELEVGAKVISGENIDFKPGNSLPLKSIPLNIPIHNVELRPGKGGQMIKSAGSMGQILAKEGLYANVQLPSGEIRKILLECYATIGQLSNPDWQNISYGKAGRKIHKGIRPHVRGVAMAPNAHPHGGGEGRSGIGMKSPKSPWGKRTLGRKTRKKAKYSNKFIVTRRKK